MSRTHWLVLGMAAMLGAAMIGSAGCEKGKAALPEPVAKAFAAAFPAGEIAKVDAEEEGGVKVFDIEFKEGGVAKETDMAADGTILTVSSVIDAKDVPEAAMAGIRKAAEGATIKQVERAEVRCETKDGKIVKLDKPRTEFEAELKKGDQSAEVTVAADGTVLESPKWGKGEKQEKK